MLHVGIAMLLPLGLTLAQQQSTAPGGAANSSQPSASNPSTSSSTGGGAARQPGTYLSGRVLMADGGELPAGVTVRRVCGTRVTAEAYTDSRGYFVLSLGGGAPLLGDASSPGGFRRADSDPSPMITPKVRNPLPATSSDCDLRAVVAGYKSDILPLAGSHPGDSGDIGTILLRRQGRNGGNATSATTGLAPKNARKFYEKGLEAIRQDGPDAAQKDFLRAVQIFPRFAEAWFELGRIYDQRVHPAEARDAYTKAIRADSGYAKPYERLCLLDVKEHLWEQAAETSGKVLGLDPIDFPEAYYVNALANYQAHHLTAAERSARKAVAMEDANPEADYVLGMILAEKGELPEAAANLRAYLAAGGSGETATTATRTLARMNQQK